MTDTIEIIGKNSLVQHGKLNNRVYLMKLDKSDFPGVLEEIEHLAGQNDYTKIFCKVPAWTAPVLFSKGYMMEAFIPGFYNNRESLFFMSKFLSSDRLLEIETEKMEALSRLFFGRPGKMAEATGLKPGDTLRLLTINDADEIVKIYQKVFFSYPFPIQDSEYIRKTMRSHVRYFGIERKGRLVALSSAEIDKSGANAEMTDFATLPDYRGGKRSVVLLEAMEKKMKEMGILTLYTIARLNSIAMNKTFLRQGYRYSGTLIKNTNIAGKIESMNVLYKKLAI